MLKWTQWILLFLFLFSTTLRAESHRGNRGASTEQRATTDAAIDPTALAVMADDACNPVRRGNGAGTEKPQPRLSDQQRPPQPGPSTAPSTAPAPAPGEVVCVTSPCNFTPHPTNDDVVKPTDGPLPPMDPSIPADIQRLMGQKCLSCHTGEKTLFRPDGKLKSSPRRIESIFKGNIPQAMKEAMGNIADPTNPFGITPTDFDHLKAWVEANAPAPTSAPTAAPAPERTSDPAPTPTDRGVPTPTTVPDFAARANAILGAKCVDCHSLAKAKRASPAQIAEMIDGRNMPPDMADMNGQANPFNMSDDEKSTIRQWAATAR